MTTQVATPATTRRAAAAVGMEPGNIVRVRADDIRGVAKGDRVTVVSYGEPFWDTVNGPKFDQGVRATIQMPNGTARTVCPTALCPEWAW